MKIGMIARNLFSRFLLIVITIIFLIPIIVFICIPQKYRYKHPIFFYPVHWFYSLILKGSMLSFRRIVNVVNNHDCNLMIFPEGTRHADGKIHEFFGGFVILAKKLNRPVVPVCMIGINKAYPPETFWVQLYPITVIVGKPFVYEQTDTDESFKKRVQQWFVEQVEQNS